MHHVQAEFDKGVHECMILVLHTHLRLFHLVVRFNRYGHCGDTAVMPVKAAQRRDNIPRAKHGED